MEVGEYIQKHLVDVLKCCWRGGGVAAGLAVMHWRIHVRDKAQYRWLRCPVPSNVFADQNKPFEFPIWHLVFPAFIRQLLLRSSTVTRLPAAR